MAERLDRFMTRAVAAYYATATPFGRQGDFTTAPAISQAFGECLGLWSALVWETMGQPRPVLFVEFGPGDGTLMADALRATADIAPAFRNAARVHLVETSARLRAAQRVRLGAAVAAWHDSPATLPAGPVIILANEFLDALPIRQFVRRGAAWHERLVAEGRFVEAPEPWSPIPRLGSAAAGTPGPGDGSPDPTAPDRPAGQGDVWESGAARDAVAAGLGARLAAQGGAALFVDYGLAAPRFGDTLQAVAAHGRANPLATPGEVDLSAHVDFAAFVAAGRAVGARAHGPLPQGVFLQRLGLAARSAALAAAATRTGRHDQARLALAGAQRLLAPEAMGRLFKAVCLCDPSLPVPPGFAPA